MIYVLAKPYNKIIEKIEVQVANESIDFLI